MNADIERVAHAPQNIAVIGLRTFPPADVDVAAVGLVPRPTREPGRPAGTCLALEPGSTDTGLTEVVHAGPDEVADDIGQPLDGSPALVRFAGERLGGDYDALGMPLVVALVGAHLVVVAADAQFREERVNAFPLRQAVDGRCHRPGGIGEAHALGQAAGDVGPQGIPRSVTSLPMLHITMDGWLRSR